MKNRKKASAAPAINEQPTEPRTTEQIMAGRWAAETKEFKNKPEMEDRAVFLFAYVCALQGLKKRDVALHAILECKHLNTKEAGEMVKLAYSIALEP